MPCTRRTPGPAGPFGRARGLPSGACALLLLGACASGVPAQTTRPAAGAAHEPGAGCYALSAARQPGVSPEHPRSAPLPFPARLRLTTRPAVPGSGHEDWLQAWPPFPDTHARRNSPLWRRAARDSLLVVWPTPSRTELRLVADADSLYGSGVVAHPAPCGPADFPVAAPVADTLAVMRETGRALGAWIREASGASPGVALVFARKYDCPNWMECEPEDGSGRPPASRVRGGEPLRSLVDAARGEFGAGDRPLPGGLPLVSVTPPDFQNADHAWVDVREDGGRYSQRFRVVLERKDGLWVVVERRLLGTT